jgi:hypothetical protein
MIARFSQILQHDERLFDEIREGGHKSIINVVYLIVHLMFIKVDFNAHSENNPNEIFIENLENGISLFFFPVFEDFFFGICSNQLEVVCLLYLGNKTHSAGKLI